MALPAVDTDSFLTLPEAQRLITIARSDNSLIMLAVQRREISWTQFMAALLDPERAGGPLAQERTADLIRIALKRLPNHIENPYGDRLDLAKAEQLDSVLSATAEQSAGKAGRIDLVVHCQVGGQDLRLLIENKIETAEHGEQLAGYVAYYQRKCSEDVLLPMLIDLGDEPAKQATCPWAPCLDRSDIAAWIEGIPEAPPLARDYLAVFEAWDIGRELRKRYPRAIGQLRRQKTTPAEWKLIESWLMDDGRSFYQATFEDPLLTTALEDHGFMEPESMGRLKGENSILVLTKPAWTVYPCGRDAPGVQVHFECDGRGRLRMDVGIYPYEGSIGKHQDRKDALATQLDLKAQLHHEVRAMLKQVELPAGIRLDQSGLRAADSPAANSAGRFGNDLGPSCTPQEYAGLIAETIHAVSPHVDAIIQA